MISFRKKRTSSMAWYALYKWYKNWSRRKYPNMIDWYSEKLNPPTWRKKEIYIDENGKMRIRDCK